MSASIRFLRQRGALIICTAIMLGGCGRDRRDGPAEPDDAQVDTVDAGNPLADAEVDADANDGAQAPPIDRTVTTDFGSAFGFIFDGPAATQVGVEKGAIDPTRMAVLRGRVVDQGPKPIAGVRVSLAGQPKLGSTQTKQDGTFDLVVNGGAAVRVAFEGANLLRAERTLRPSWNAFERVPDVILMPVDPQVSEVRLGADSVMQVATGSRITDRSGGRTGTLAFRSGTSANLVLPDGSKQPLADAHVRITEYTVGDGGPNAMPASLPPQSGYTYAVELSVDEAQTAGAQTVEFSKPVAYYVENFLRFPVGEPVPSGYFDRNKGEWVAATSGRVIKVLSTAAGSTQIDSDGDGQADGADALSALGVDGEELAMLAASYPSGSELWRVPIPHFSTWDFNWCFFGRLFDAISDLFSGGPLPDSCQAQGSLIECENQILGESVPIPGTSYGLHYRSDRVPGRRDAYHFELQLTGASAPPSAKRARLELDILGQHVTHVVDATPNQRYAFDWDGRDAYGRVWQGPALVRYRVGYVYDGWYSHTPVFGAYGEVDRTRWSTVPDNQQARPPGVTAEDDLARLETTMWLPWQSATLGTLDASALGFGGLTLGIHHAYDAASHTLYLGTGERRQATSDANAVRAILGAVGGKSDASGQARRTSIEEPHGVAIAADGSIYVSLEAQHRVIRVDKGGNVTVIAGTGTAGATGDGGPAIAATLNEPLGLAIAQDGTLYIAERLNRTVRRVRPDGIIERFAGGGPDPDDGTPKPALSASFQEPHALDLGLDGSLFIADSRRNNVRRVRTDGVIETVLGSGTGEAGDSGDGGPGVKALITDPLSVAVASDGSLYVAEYQGHRIRRLTPDGSVMTVAGTGEPGRAGDDGPAVAALLNNPHTVDVGADGTLYITDEGNGLLRSVTPDGLMHTVAGGGDTRADDFCPALDAHFELPRITVVEPNGNLIVADYDGNFVYRVAPALPPVSPDGSVIADESGGSYFVFDSAGRHLQTVNAYTKQVLWSFEYDAAGRLSRITDAAQRALVVQRDAGGRATALVSPDGLATSLRYDGKGWLSDVVNAAGEVHHLALSDSGLLLSETDSAGRLHSFEYDAAGRLTRDTEASGAFQTLERTSESEQTVVRKNALGHSWTYAREQVEGASKRTTTQPDGLRTITLKERTSSRSTLPDGSSITIVLAADPRFGMQAAYASSTTLQTPSGLMSTLERSRAITLENPDDPSSLQTLTEQATLSDALVAKTVFDRAARTLTTTARGDTTRSTLDERGRIVKIEPAGKLSPVTVSYDAQGRVAQVTQGQRTLQRHYDERGFLDQVTDPAGRTFSFSRDALGRPLSSSVGQQPLVSFAYAPGGDLQQLLAPSQSMHALSYDGGGRFLGYRGPATTRAFTYGADDELTGATLPSGRTVTATRDDKARLVAVTMPEASSAFRYDDATGSIIEASSGNEQLTLTWDGPLLVRTIAQGSAAGTVSASYDGALRVSEQTAAGVSLAYEYDSSGRLIGAGNERLTYRDARRIGSTVDGTLRVEFTYSNDFGELSRQRASASATLYEVTYERDALGRVTSTAENVAGESQTRKFSYDVQGRLSTAEDAQGVQTYAYDADGNRIDGDASYDARGLLVRRGTVNYAYDVDGYLHERSDASGTRSFNYDARGQLRSVALPNTSIEYAIDALGRRVAKRVNGAITQAFLYDLQGRIVAELDGNGALVSRFVYGARANVPDYLIKAGVTLHIVSDPLGSPRLVVDSASGAVVQRMDYDAWGNLIRDSAPGTQPFGFAGGLWDADTRLLRFGVRDYDPEVGRWTVADPLLFAGGQPNLYAYANNDPINRIDVDGRSTLVIGAEAGAELGTLVFPGAGTVIGGIIGAGVGIWLGDKLVDWIVTNASTEAPTPPSIPADWDGTTPPAEGWEWRGPDAPGGPRGGWVSPDGSESLHPDFGHPQPVGPHVDWNDPSGGRWRIFPDGTCTPK